MRKQNHILWEELNIQLESQNMCLVDLPKPPYKQSLIQCLSQLLILQSQFLHQHIGTQLQICFTTSTLPRRLSYIYDDHTIIDDYKNDANLVTFAKITMEMISHVYERKMSLYQIGKDQFLTRLIINEGSYHDSTEIKIAKVGNSYARIQEIQPIQVLNQINQNNKKNVQDSHDEDLYEAFRSQNYLEINKPQELLYKQSLIKSTVSIGKSKKVVQFQPSIKEDLSIKAQDEGEEDSKNKEDGKLIGECNLINQNNNSSNTGNNNGTNQISPPRNFNVVPDYMDMYNYPYNPNYYQNFQQNMYYRQSPNGHGSEGFIQSSFTTPSSPMRRKSPPQNNNNNNKQCEISDKQRYTGRLKFFDEAKNYGFIIMDADDSDIFVHFDDIQKAGISKEKIKSYKQNQGYIKFEFKVMIYYGKYKQSRKAVELTIVQGQQFVL